ncbi:MAG: CRISPR-associated endonuclease Cas2 [Parcubacteria group bacterium CG23_combo_of_CG06-09_8_20_14_all_35_9]|nr:MAG: CRISPR-associated endonuclease Cas2 [Parcubacteria group bacterium CG23_combo_of_CG06-09_8_20_14_all_35_9]
MTLTFIEKLLLEFCDFIETFQQPITMKKVLYREFYKEQIQFCKSKREKNRFYTTIRRLKKDKYFQIKKDGRKLKYLLTPKGKTKVLKAKGKLKREKKWDGKWRMVVFDIPEKKRKNRDIFRNGLQEFGFKMLQKSVWISPYPVLGEIEDLAKDYFVKFYINLLVVESIEGEEKLIRLFNIEKEGK